MQTYRKQRVWRVAGVCLLAVLLLLGAGRRTEAAAPVADTFDISLTYGYDNSVKYNRDAAFHVQVTSKDADFSGKVHLLTSAYRQDVYYGSGSLMSLPFGHRAYALSYDNYGVSKVLELEPGQSKTVTFTLPMTGCSPFVKIQLIGADGQIQAEKDFSLSVRTSSGEFLAGVLTDDPTGMQYLDGLRTSAYSSVSLAAVLLDETTLEDTRAGLDMLDLLLVQDFDTDRLRTEQKEAIKRWVRDGGVLVQGGGQKAADMADLTPEIEPYGEGRIVTYPQRLTMGEDEVAGTDLMGQMLLEDCFSRQQLEEADPTVTHTGDDYWVVSSELEGVSMEHIPKTGRYAVVLAVYVILAGPVVYLVLKKFHGRKYIWGCEGVLAILFSGIVFVMGSRTRFNAPFVNYVRKINLMPGVKDEKVDFSVRAPYNTAYSIYVNQDYDLMPVCDTAYYGATYMDAVPDFSRESMQIAYGETENVLSMESDRAFTAKYVQASRTEKTDADFGVQGELCYFDGALTGTLVNRTSYNLTDVFLIFQNHLVYVEQFPAGGSLDVGTCSLYSFVPGEGYEIVQKCLDYEAGYHREVNADFLDACWKTSILSNQLEEGYEKEPKGCRLVGFVDGVPLDLLKDSAYQTEGQTLVNTDISLSYEKEENGKIWKYFPFITSTVRVVSGDYVTYNNTAYGNDVVLEYQVPEDVQDLSLMFGREDYYDADAYQEFAGTIEIYNYRAGRYEKVSEEDELTGDRLEQCISLDHRLLLRYRDTTVGSDKSDKLPILIMKGRI